MARTLVIAPAWVGDMVMAQALFARLKARDPEGEVHVVAPPATLSLVSRMPVVARGWELKVGHGDLALGARGTLGLRLRSERFDRAIVLPRSLKAALVPFFAGIPRRRGFLGEWRYGLLNEVVPRSPGDPRTVDEFLALCPDDPAPMREAETPRLVVRSEAAAETLARLGLAAGGYVALCPGAEYGPAKRWPAERFRALAERLLAERRGVVVIGSPKESDLTAAIAEGLPGVVDLGGRTRLVEAVDVLSVADAVVANDSGLMHVAAALGRPLVALYGSSSPVRTPPLSIRASVVTALIDLPCRPCFARDCRFGHTRCLSEITSDAVLARLPPARTAGG